MASTAASWPLELIAAVHTKRPENVPASAVSPLAFLRDPRTTAWKNTPVFPIRRSMTRCAPTALTHYYFVLLGQSLAMDITAANGRDALLARLQYYGWPSSRLSQATKIAGKESGRADVLLSGTRYLSQSGSIGRHDPSPWRTRISNGFGTSLSYGLPPGTVIRRWKHSRGARRC